MGLLDNGYQVQKFWYDRNGIEVDVSSGVLPAKQGDLFTVVIEVDRTKSGYGTDLLVTDLLPAGFEIENATLGDPTIDGLTLDFEQGMKPSYTASMDDRFIAHFDNRWKQGSFAYVRYSVRASYETNAVIPDAVVEEMYALKSMDAQYGSEPSVTKGALKPISLLSLFCHGMIGYKPWHKTGSLLGRLSDVSQVIRADDGQSSICVSRRTVLI